MQKPRAAFSHVLAAKYAGLGTVGFSHALLTEAYGPRVRFVSLLTDAALPADAMLERELCIHCLRCSKVCPSLALPPSPQAIADMDKLKCASFHEELKDRYCYPCGACIQVCPIGQDRKRYGSNTQNAEHIRQFGSFTKNNIV
jgi:epoxyqueuosine reductase QueG